MMKCCLNCHYYLNDDANNCQGMKDVQNDYCYEYKYSLYKSGDL